MRATQLLQPSRLAIASLLISFGIALAPSARAGQVETLVEGNTAFALALYSSLSGTPGNIFFSPYSISSCLAMTYAGARGDTETQMGRVLHFDERDAKLHSSFGKLQRQLSEAEKQKGIQLNIANSLWVQKGEPFLPAFLEIAKHDYQADVDDADFKTDADAVTGEINRWVARKTMDKIQDILAPGSVNDRTRLVLANAIYFKGTWARRFQENATFVQPFHLSENSQTDASLMHHVDDVKFSEDNDLQVVELPYSGDELSMVILLPRKINGLGQLEQQLSPAFLKRLLAWLKQQKVEIILPKFKLESGFKLNDALMKMGMPDAFGPSADFSGLNGIAGDLYISGVFHKAWVEVAEAGTEAAAATVVTISTLSIDPNAPAPPPVFRADHPFLFLIRDTRSSSLLFVGRMADPRS